MVAKTSILKELETIYEKSGNQLYVLYGRTDSEKEQLLKAFLSNKKYFYYRSRQASEQEQRNQMEAEIRQKFLANITKHSYDEFFNRIKSGDASKLVVVIDELSANFRAGERKTVVLKFYTLNFPCSSADLEFHINVSVGKCIL